MSRKVPFFTTATKTGMDAKLGDLHKLTTSEIRELLERQRKIQSNKLFISKLPDKGAKIAVLTEKLEETLKEKEARACDLFEKLSLNSLDHDAMQSVEWKRRTENKQNIYLDSDDDSEPDDLIHVLAQKTMHERKIKVLKSEPSLITSTDLSDIVTPEQPKHVKYIMSMTEKTAQNMNTPFKPYRTTISDVHDPCKEKFRKQCKNWEVTAATQPPIKHGPAKVLSIEESIKLQTELNKQLKEVETKHASERLMMHSSAKIGEFPKYVSNSQQYREVYSEDLQASDNELNEGSDNEVHDDEPDSGDIVFTVMK